MKKDSPYTCVSCDFYDILEIFAMRKNQVQIIYTTEQNTKHTLVSYIKTLVTRNKEEFIVTLSGMEIRLDRIVDITKYAA